MRYRGRLAERNPEHLGQIWMSDSSSGANDGPWRQGEVPKGYALDIPAGRLLEA